MEQNSKSFDVRVATPKSGMDGVVVEIYCFKQNFAKSNPEEHDKLMKFIDSDEYKIYCVRHRENDWDALDTIADKYSFVNRYGLLITTSDLSEHIHDTKGGWKTELSVRRGWFTEKEIHSFDEIPEILAKQREKLSMKNRGR